MVLRFSVNVKNFNFLYLFLTPRWGGQATGHAAHGIHGVGAADGYHTEATGVDGVQVGADHHAAICCLFFSSHKIFTKPATL